MAAGSAGLLPDGGLGSADLATLTIASRPCDRGAAEPAAGDVAGDLHLRDAVLM